MGESEKSSRLKRIEANVIDLNSNINKSGLYDYLAYVNDKKKLYTRSFVLGLFRGIGSAIGFSICAAIIIIILNRLAMSSVPYLAEFISEILSLLEKGV